VFPQNYPFLDEAHAQSRAQLQSAFEKNLKWQVVADRLIEAGLAPDTSEPIVKTRDIVRDNIASILHASKTCYDEPLHCTEEVQKLHLSPVNPDVLTLPPLPTASYRLVTTGRGIWTREASVAQAGTKLRHCFFDCPDSNFFEYEPEAETLGFTNVASIGLYIQGAALKEARLYFEGNLLRKIPLTPQSSAFPGKAGKDFALLILETTRGNPGWRDVNLAAAREELASKTMPKADGVFYFIVLDGFGRETRFDIEYAKWERSVSKEEKSTRVKESWKIRNRWWDPNSDGTSVSGTGHWTGNYFSDGEDCSGEC
jgi:hypothetical protein